MKNPYKKCIIILNLHVFSFVIELPGKQDILA